MRATIMDKFHDTTIVETGALRRSVRVEFVSKLGFSQAQMGFTPRQARRLAAALLKAADAAEKEGK